MDAVGRLQDIANLRWSALDTQKNKGSSAFASARPGAARSSACIGTLRIGFQQSVPEDPDAYVFPTLANRSGAGRNGLSRAFERIMERAGVKNRLIRERSGGKSRSLRGLSFHSFRHSAASAVFTQLRCVRLCAGSRNHAAGGVVGSLHPRRSRSDPPGGAARAATTKNRVTV